MSDFQIKIGSRFSINQFTGFPRGEGGVPPPLPLAAIRPSAPCPDIRGAFLSAIATRPGLPSPIPAGEQRSVPEIV